VTGPVLVDDTDGALIATLGWLLTTLQLALGPAAGAEPTAFEALPASIEIPRLPVPVQADIVTVRVVVPVPDTVTTPFAVPVLLSTTFADVRLIVVAPV